MINDGRCGEVVPGVVVAAGAWAVARCATTPPGRRPASVGRRHGAGRDPVCAANRVRLVSVSRVVGDQCSYRPSPVHRVQRRAGVHPAAPGTAGTARHRWSDRLAPGGGGQNARPGGQKGDLTGPSPVDRDKPGSKVHADSERSGIPLTVVISAVYRNDHRELETLIDAVAPIRGPVGRPRCRPCSCTRTRATTIRHAETRCVGEESSPDRSPGYRVAHPAGAPPLRHRTHPGVGFLFPVDWLAVTSARPPTYAAFACLACAVICYRRAIKLDLFTQNNPK